MEGMETRNQASKSKALNNAKIINSLNADCWRHILDYLPVKDLLRSEATCKEWQKLVLNDISRRGITICGHERDTDTLILKQNAHGWSLFKRWVNKCGHAIVNFDMDCQHFRDVVEILREHCPNLIALRLSRLKTKLPPTTTLHFPKMTWLALEYCDDITDDCISQFLNTDTADLIIIYSKRVTGRFLRNLKSDNLKHLQIRQCRAFKFSYLLSARLSNLRVLYWKQNNSKVQIREKFNLLFEKMPILLEIGFDVYDINNARYQECIAESNGFFEGVCRLSQLKVLNGTLQVWDHHLEALASNCKELTVVTLGCHHVTRRGIDALCRVGGQLVEVDLSESQITDDDIVAFVFACPNLLYLNISDCHLLESALQRIAVARRDMRDMPSNQHFENLSTPLQITISKWDDYGVVDECEEMIEVLDNVIYI